MASRHLTPREKALIATRAPIKERLAAAFEGKRELTYWEVANAVFPQEEYPRSWQRPSQGGPPGCYMTLTRALKRYGYVIDENAAGWRVVRRARA